MRLPKPKSAPGVLLYLISAVTTLLIGRLGWILAGQNVEVLSAEKGYDKLLSRHWSEILAWFAVNGFWLSLLTAVFLGGTIALWAYIALLSKSDGQAPGRTWTRPLADKQSQREKVTHINNVVAEIYQTIGMAIGSENKLTYDLAIAQCESFLVDLARRNSLAIPKLHSDGTEAGTLRALDYLNALLPALQLDDDVEARKRANEIVPKLNAMTAAEIRKEMGAFLPSKQAPTAPTRENPVAVSLSSSGVFSDGPHYEYPKAVLQLDKPRITRLARSGGELGRVDAHLEIKNVCYMDLKQCAVMLTSMGRAHKDLQETIMKPLYVGTNHGTGKPAQTFALGKAASKNVPLLHRDLTDVVSNPPFLLKLADGNIPLADNSEYFLSLELRSEARDVTLVDLEIAIGVGPNVTVTLQDQRVEARASEH